MPALPDFPIPDPSRPGTPGHRRKQGVASARQPSSGAGASRTPATLEITCDRSDVLSVALATIVEDNQAIRKPRPGGRETRERPDPASHWREEERCQDRMTRWRSRSR